MKQSNRALALLLALTLSMGMMSVARAAISATCYDAVFTESGGMVMMQIFVNPNSASNVDLISIVPNKDSILESVKITGLQPIQPSGSWVEATGTLKKTAIGGKTYPEGASSGEFLNLYISGSAAPIECRQYSIKVINTPATTPNPNATPTPEDKEAKLRISPVDRYGQVVPAPAGDYGETISIRVPLKCYRSSVYDVKIAPVLSNDIEKYPFDIEAVDYMLSYPNSVAVGDIIEFQYNLRLSKKATTGVKQVDFSLS
ncbi:MAG: hypothetical protein EOM66_03560, partial [Clostridia bacterium]|nr:hypothetical protein [Clostridia bacterium]